MNWLILSKKPRDEIAEIRGHLTRFVIAGSSFSIPKLTDILHRSLARLAVADANSDLNTNFSA